MVRPYAAPVVLLPPVALDANVAKWLDVPGLQGLSLPGTGVPGTSPLGSLDDLADWVADQIADQNANQNAHQNASQNTDPRAAPVHLVGCSLGGMVAMHVALRHPQHVRSMLLAFTTARVDREAILQRAEWTAQVGARGAVAETLERWFSAEALAVAPRPAPIAYAVSSLEEADTAALAATWRAIADHDVLGDLDRVRVPVTFVGGRRDRSVPIESVRAAAAVVPGARLVETDDPHMGLLQRPEDFSALVRDHLTWADNSHQIDATSEL